MFLAFDNDTQKDIYAKDAAKGHHFTCRNCGHELILKRGKIHLPHFSHREGESCVAESSLYADKHAYELYSMLNTFAPHTRDIPFVSYNGDKFFAHFYAGGIAIRLTTNSKIDMDNFETLTNAMLKKSRRVFWIIDLSNRSEKLYEKDAYYKDDELSMFSFSRSNKVLNQYSYNYKKDGKRPVGMTNKVTGEFFPGASVFLYHGDNELVQVCAVPGKNPSNCGFFAGRIFTFDEFAGAIRRVTNADSRY